MKSSAVFLPKRFHFLAWLFGFLPTRAASSMSRPSVAFEWNIFANVHGPLLNIVILAPRAPVAQEQRLILVKRVDGWRPFVLTCNLTESNNGLVPHPMVRISQRTR